MLSGTNSREKYLTEDGDVEQKWVVSYFRSLWIRDIVMKYGSESTMQFFCEKME